jgi:hypothetical protein
MLNPRLLAAWPNWVIIPVMIAIWIAVGVLGAELLGADPYVKE